MYVHRSPFNVDNSYLLGIRAALDHTDWRVALYTGAGVFQRNLFSVDAGWNWRITWDRLDPQILYIQDNDQSLFAYHVGNDTLTLLRQFSPYVGFVGGSEPSLNQTNTRVLVYVSESIDRVGVPQIRSYRLSDMGDEKILYPSMILPAGATIMSSGMGTPHYIGYGDHIAMAWQSADATGLLVYDEATSSTIHNFIGDSFGGGHFAFSSTGKLAYRTWNAGLYFTTYWASDYNDLEIHVVNINGTDDHVVFRASEAEAWWVQNLHLAWPATVANWFLVGFYPPAYLGLPILYVPPYDEILQVFIDGTPSRYLTRTGTKSFGPPIQGWSQPLPAPSPDGTRVSFNAVCDLDNVGSLGCTPTGTIDQYIFYIYPRRS